MPNGFISPKKIFSEERLLDAWTYSRDSRNPAVPGIDGQSAKNFGSSLTLNLKRLRTELIKGQFYFSSLKPIALPKTENTFRIICVPTVRDRLVQRAIIRWLDATKKFPVLESSYGVKDRGAHAALERALTLRRSHEWCVKTDIQSFFDRIDRQQLIDRVRTRLRRCSALPLLESVVELEAIVPPAGSQLALRIKESGIVRGRGLRQGMPLSPILANIALWKFDQRCQRRGMTILRYADDLVAFFQSENEAREGFEFITSELADLGLGVPELGKSKSSIVSRQQVLPFLGREILFLARVNDYVCRVGDSKIAAIKKTLETEYSLPSIIKTRTLTQAINALSCALRSYLGAYKDAQNYIHFSNEVRGQFRKILNSWFVELFGEQALSNLTEMQRKFLGLPLKLDLEPTDDIDLVC